MNATAAKPELNMGAETAEAPQISIVRDGMVKTIERIIADDRSRDGSRCAITVLLDLAGFNHQKSHALLELTRALRAMPHDSIDQRSSPRSRASERNWNQTCKRLTFTSRPCGRSRR